MTDLIKLCCDENKNACFSIKATGERIITVNSSGVEVHLALSGTTIDSILARLDALEATTTAAA